MLKFMLGVFKISSPGDDIFGVNFNNLTWDQNYDILLTGCCLAIWEIRGRMSKKNRTAAF